MNHSGMKIAQRLALATVIMTLILIAAGVITRATGSGLGCPDWPLCDGKVVPRSEQTAVIEVTHRAIASFVGLMIIANAVMAWKYFRNVKLVVWAATVAVPLVGIQGLLGALTVIWLLPPEIVASHLTTAMIVLTFEILVFFGMYFEAPEKRAKLVAAREPARRVGMFAAATLVWLLFVMWIGGYLTESGASTACKGWPACNGSVLPGADAHEVVHMAHRYLAGALIFFIVPFVVTAWRRRASVPFAGPVAITAGVLYAAQVVVGALNVWYTFPDILTVSHTVIAAGIWATLISAAIIGFYAPVRASRTGPVPAGVPA